MGTWLITDPKATRIYGTVEAANEVEAAGRTDLGQAVWFWQSEPSPNDQLGLRDMVSVLGDGQWRELGTSMPLPGGDVGGDAQDSEAYTRRFGLVRRDGNWAVVTVYFYVMDMISAHLGTEIFLERQVKLMVAKDVHDLGGTEIIADYKHDRVLDHPITEQGALLAAAAFDSRTIEWDGRVDPRNA
jgi:hypothetical protein